MTRAAAGGLAHDASDGEPSSPAAAVSHREAYGEPEGRHATATGRQATLERLRAQRDHLAICRWLHELAPLTAHYRQPKGAFYCQVVEGWAA